jgi:hypothetical protein
MSKADLCEVVMPVKRIVILSLIMALFPGCTSLIRPDAVVPLAVNTEDARAKNFLPISDKSVVYIFRDGSSAYYNKIVTYVDDRYVADIVRSSYARIILEPGLHHVVSKAERECSLEIEVKPGQIYFVVQKDKFGVMSPRCSMRIIPVEEGRKSVQGCRLVLVQDANP